MAFFIFGKKKEAPPPPIDLPPEPGSTPIDFQEKVKALEFYANRNRKSWEGSLKSMSPDEIDIIYRYVFEYLIYGKRVPDPITSRLKIIGYKYQVSL